MENLVIENFPNGQQKNIHAILLTMQNQTRDMAYFPWQLRKKKGSWLDEIYLLKMFLQSNVIRCGFLLRTTAAAL